MQVVGSLYINRLLHGKMKIKIIVIRVLIYIFMHFLYFTSKLLSELKLKFGLCQRYYCFHASYIFLQVEQADLYQHDCVMFLWVMTPCCSGFARPDGTALKPIRPPHILWSFDDAITAIIIISSFSLVSFFTDKSPFRAAGGRNTPVGQRTLTESNATDRTNKK